MEFEIAIIRANALKKMRSEVERLTERQFFSFLISAHFGTQISVGFIPQRQFCLQNVSSQPSKHSSRNESL